MLLVLFLVAAVEAQLSAQNAVLVLQTFTSPSPQPTCAPSAFLETAYEFTVKTSNTALWCAQTPTSFLNYLFVFKNNQTFQVQSFGALDTNCTGAPIQTQTGTYGSCFHLIGDNPAVSYQVSLQSGACSSGSCSGTCCWSPQGNGCASGVTNACCCPDFQNACNSGEACICGGECPGPGCQCLGCGPSNEGYCLNQ